MNLKVVLHPAREGGYWAEAPRCPRLRHVPATQWGLRKYMNIRLPTEMDQEVACSAA